MPGVVLVDSQWQIDPQYQLGPFLGGNSDASGNHVPPRSGSGRVRPGKQGLGFRTGVGPTCVFGQDVSRPLGATEEPILEKEPGEFLQRLLRVAPSLQDAPSNQFSGGWFKLWAILFPEEVRHREVGEGWMFIIRTDANVNRLNRKIEKFRRRS